MKKILKQTGFNFGWKPVHVEPASENYREQTKKRKIIQILRKSEKCPEKYRNLRVAQRIRLKGQKSPESLRSDQWLSELLKPNLNSMMEESSP